jgi:hypothetical protein
MASATVVTVRLTVTTVAALARAASNPAGIVILLVGSAVLTAKWVFDVYENTYVPCLGSDSNLLLNACIALTTLLASRHIL